MTAPAPSPKEPAKRSKRMLGFYIAMGVVALLLVAFYFTWTPLKVWYWERELRSFLAESARERSWYAGMELPAEGTVVIHFGKKETPALGKLLRAGPIAWPALKRIFDGLQTRQRADFFGCLRDSEERWPLQLAVSAAEDERGKVLTEALDAAESLTNESFFPKGRRWTKSFRGGAARDIDQEELKRARIAFLSWWEREGRAKYGRGVE